MLASLIAEFATTKIADGVVRSDGMSGIRLVHEEIVRMQVRVSAASDSSATRYHF